MDLYYEEFVKLSRYAPLMTQEQKLDRLILGLGDELADEVHALRPTNLADAHIKAKAKLSRKAKSRTSTTKRPIKNYYGSENRKV